MIRRHSAGCYTFHFVVDRSATGVRNCKIEVVQGDDKLWIARAGWDCYIVSDPLPSYRAAKAYCEALAADVRADAKAQA